MTSNALFTEKQDANLDKALDNLGLKITLMGVGGTGCNIVQRAGEVGIEGVHLIGIDQDARSLAYHKIEEKIFLFRKLSDDGTGTYEHTLEEAFENESGTINKIMEKTDLAFLLSSLGGETGAVLTPRIAEIAKEHGIIVFAICVLPFSVEGDTKGERARRALEEVTKTAGKVISIKNDSLLDIDPKVPLHEAFGLLDDKIVRLIKGMIAPSESEVDIK